MCNFLSFIATRDGQFLCNPLTDSHSDLIQLYGLKDTDAYLKWFAKFEFVPAMVDGKFDYANIDAYTLNLDEQEEPVWVTDSLKEQAKTFAVKTVNEMIVNDNSHKILLGGAWIICGNAKVRKVRMCRVLSVSDSAQIESVYGSAQIGYVYDSAQIKYVSDSAQIKSVSGSAQIEYVYDSAQIGYVYDSAQIEYVSGSAQIESVYDSAQIGYVYGSAQIKYVYGSAQIKSVYDSAQIINDKRVKK